MVWKWKRTTAPWQRRKDLFPQGTTKIEHYISVAFLQSKAQVVAVTVLSFLEAGQKKGQKDKLQEVSAQRKKHITRTNMLLQLFCSETGE